MSRLIIFGTGVIGKKAYELLGEDRIVAFCDNNTHSENELFQGKPVYNARVLHSVLDEDCRVVLATTKLKNVVDISRQLDEMGIPFVLLEDVARQIVRDEAKIYEEKDPPSTFKYDCNKEYIIPMERIEEAGVISSYLWQDLWAARYIIDARPEIHYDIGSRLDGFITHLLGARIHVTMLDIRPLPTKIPGLDFVQADATNLDSIPDESLESLSALCSLEHFGLGRYGDPIDPMACFKCFDAIQKKMKPGGLFYLSVPIGKEHLEFNAHRVFAPSTIINSFQEMDLLEFSSCWNDEYDENVSIDKYDEWDKYGGERFGLFRFRKLR